MPETPEEVNDGDRCCGDCGIRYISGKGRTRVNATPYANNPTLTEFVHHVQERAGLDSYNEAHQLTCATVRALGASISGGQAKQLAEWLPDTLRHELADKSGQASAFDKTNFLDKVAGQMHSPDAAGIEPCVAAALGVLRTSAPRDQIDDTLALLPSDLTAMFR